MKFVALFWAMLLTFGLVVQYSYQPLVTAPVLPMVLRTAYGVRNAPELAAKSRFGKGVRRNADGSLRDHGGIDVVAPKGTRLAAVAYGKVIEARYRPLSQGSYPSSQAHGNRVIVRSLFRINGRLRVVSVLYAHMDQVFVHKGQWVSPGTIVGTAGLSGNASGLKPSEEHVHIECQVDERPDHWLKPEQYFSKKRGSVWVHYIDPEIILPVMVRK